MKFLKNTDPRFHLVEARTGLFIGLAVLGLISIVAFVFWKQEIFRPSHRIYLLSESSQGIKEGMAARLSGFRIGKVSKVELEGENLVRVSLDVFSEYFHFLKTDSVATISSEGLIGDRFIELTTGTKSASQVGDDGVIHLSPEKSMNAMMESLRDEIKPALIDTREIIAYLNNPEGDMKVLLRNLKNVSQTVDQQLPNTFDETKATLANTDDLVAEIKKATVPLQQSLENIETLSARLKTDIPEITRKIDSALLTLDNAAAKADAAMAETEALARDLRSVVEESADDVPRLVRKGSDTVEKADQVMDSVRGMWPVRKGIPEEKETTLRPPGDE
jgi:phospholipid/cholesterol/gamma-HCH transport system substrate-binding protein